MKKLKKIISVLLILSIFIINTKNLLVFADEVIIKNKVEKNRGFLIDCWNNMTDGINVDIDYRFGITSFRNVLTDYEGVKERN